MSHTYAVVLAAGQGTRMKSKLYKVLHPVCGKPMVEHVVDMVSELGVSKMVTIVGHGADKVKSQLGERSEYALQAEQLGTAHAVQQASTVLEKLDGTTIVICGDTPLIKKETMDALLAHHHETNAKATILTAKPGNPTGYGRIIRGEEGFVKRIVEQKDASLEEQKVNEINSGTYCFDNRLLFELLKLVKNDNAQGEYYLPDVIELLTERDEIVSAYATEDFDETLGVNDRVALSEAEEIMQARILEKHMRAGVTIQNRASTKIGADVVIGSDTVLLPGCVLEGKTIIGEDCIIGPNVHIVDSRIGNNTKVHSSVVQQSTIGDATAVGPFAHLRPKTNVGNEAKIGNFVELKNTQLGNEAKVSHLSYIGDAVVGERVNIGCGTITVNYDGKNKFQTTIEADAFVGCNSNLVAPVTVGEGAYVAAGTTVTKNVPSDALAIGRVKQENKDGYAAKIKRK